MDSGVFCLWVGLWGFGRGRAGIIWSSVQLRGTNLKVHEVAEALHLFFSKRKKYIDFYSLGFFYWRKLNIL